ncbi:hypothetical protein JKF63_02741 [Porcisia hertigi]|uniref:Kinetoplast DNA-associated protein n=1 Tax=Porcisia hertigi TaxID=2761500 RepID=A0A836HP74_9TRYP|nr:hypothetical protein JKF63_02741 [Porcisia hertigi]
MFRRSQTFFRVSPFALYMKELASAGKLRRVKNLPKAAAKLYRNISPAEKRALLRRAKAKTFPSQEAYRSMARREMKRLRSMPIEKRVEKIKAKWASMKKSMSSTASKAVPSAKKKVKAASKKGKRAEKRSKK